MPNFNRRDEQFGPDELDIAARIMDTVAKQVASYQSALGTLRDLRAEIADGSLQDQTVSSPEELAALLGARGIPQPLSVAMAAEDFQDEAFMAEAGLWTWDCCCTRCCLTSCSGTVITRL
jgi:hypothetical protein